MSEAREDLKTLSIGKVYPLLQYLAKRAGLSVSAWVRTTVLKEYRKVKKRMVEISGGVSKVAY